MKKINEEKDQKSFKVFISAQNFEGSVLLNILKWMQQQQHVAIQVFFKLLIF